MGGRGGSSGIANKGNRFGLLGTTIENASTRELTGAYDQLNKTAFTKLSQEERMVKSLVTDELYRRGTLISDRATDEPVKNTKGYNILFDESTGNSYRIDGVEHRHLGGMNTVPIAKASYLFRGEWKPVKDTSAMAIKLGREWEKKKRKK